MSDQHDNHPIDRLTEQGRVRGESRMIREGANARDVTRDIAQEVIRRVDLYKREKDVSYAQIAKGIGIAEATLSQVRSGTYKGDWQAKILDVAHWLDDQVATDKAPKPADFVSTRVAREISMIADAAIALKTIALVYGPQSSGIGKTMALQALAGDKAGCIFVTIDKAAAHAGGILQQICRHLRIGFNYSHEYCFNKICDALHDTNRLLIVDQIHNLCGARGDKPFYVLTDLHDRTARTRGEAGIPMLWAGTSDVVAYLRRGQAKGQEPLAQIRSRIGIQRDLMQRTRGGGGDGEPLATLDEIRKVCGQGTMRLATDAARYLMRLHNLPDSGAYRTCKNLVVMATMLYQSKGDVLTEEMLRSAHRLLVPDAAFSLLQADIEQSSRIVAKVG
ncbi:MAG: AAA family ATPase [Tepidisphaeraceae bacterium]